MKRNLETRLAKLEAQRCVPEVVVQAVHQIAAYTDQEESEKIAAMIATGEARESDVFIVLKPLRANA